MRNLYAYVSKKMHKILSIAERALYGCECALHPLFNIALSNRRLDYRQAENRPFFCALFRYMMLISQRGCHRTALEFAKLLYRYIWCMFMHACFFLPVLGFYPLVFARFVNGECGRIANLIDIPDADLGIMWNCEISALGFRGFFGQCSRFMSISPCMRVN